MRVREKERNKNAEVFRDEHFFVQALYLQTKLRNVKKYCKILYNMRTQLDTYIILTVHKS